MKVVKKNKKDFHESDLLKLNCNKSKTKLNWSSILSFKETIRLSVDWYKNYYISSNNVYKYSASQIEFYQKLLKKGYTKDNTYLRIICFQNL